MYPRRRRTGARADLGGHRLARLGIIRRLRQHSNRAARHCAAGPNPGGSTMSHFFCRSRLLTTAALAVSTLSRRMVQRSAAAPLVAHRGSTQLLPPTHLLAVPWAIRLSALARAADPNGDPAAPAVIPPIRSHPKPPAQRWTAPRGSRHIGPAAKPPQAHRNAGGPGSDWYRSPGPRFYLPISIAKEPRRLAPAADHDQLDLGKPAYRRHRSRSAAARPQEAAVYGRRSRPSLPRTLTT